MAKTKLDTDYYRARDNLNVALEKYEKLYTLVLDENDEIPDEALPELIQAAQQAAFALDVLRDRLMTDALQAAISRHTRPTDMKREFAKIRADGTLELLQFDTDLLLKLRMVEDD